jgi:RNA polymerase sigma-70 factor (family 1)
MASRSNNSHLKDLTPEALLEMVKGDNMEAFEELYFRYWKTLYSFAYKKVGTKEIAEEIVQEFLTNLWANRKQLTINSSFTGYIFIAVRNLVVNYISREMRRNTYSQFAKLFRSDIDESTEQTIMIRDLHLNMQRELEFLPSKCRSVFEMSRLDFKTNKQIAEELGISEKAVEGHLTRAIRRLRISLNTIFFFF